MSDDLTRAINDLRIEFKSQSDNIIARMLAETERRQSLDAIIEETNRRIAETERQRSTTARRRLLRNLRSKLATLRADIDAAGRRLASLETNLTKLRTSFRDSIRNLIKGGITGVLADAGIDFLSNAVSSAIWQNVEDNYDKENERRCIFNSMETMLECFGKGSWSLDRNKSYIRIGGKLANAHDFLQIYYKRVANFYDNRVLYDNMGTAQKLWAKAWLLTQQDFFSKLEKLIEKGSLEKRTDTEYDYFQEEKDVNVCEKKKRGEQYPRLN